MDEIRNAILSARAEQVGLIQKSIVNAEEVLNDDEDVRKAKDAESVDDEEDSEKEKEEGNEDGEKDAKDDDNPDGGDADDEEKGGCGSVKKSDIAEALSGYGSAIKIKKKGKEIKEHLKDVLIPELNARLAELSGKADKLLESCGNAPTRQPDSWWTDGIKIDCGYKVYDWREMECCKTDGRVMYATLSAEDAAEKKGNIPENEEQAVARRDYNEAVRGICNVKVDLKTCEIMQNLKDNEEYELNPRQVIALKF